MVGTMAFNWRTKLSLLLLIFSLTPLLIMAVSSFEILVRTFEQSTFQSVEALAKAKAEAIDGFTDFRRRDVERIGNLMAPYVTGLQRAEREMSKDEPKPPADSLPQLKDAEVISPAVRSASKPPAASERPNPAPSPDGEQEELRARAASPGDEAKRYQEAFSRLKQTLGFILWDQKDFEELLVIDSAGRVLASTFEGHEGTSAENLEYFQHARRGTYVQPVFMSPITNELTMVIATPIRNENLEHVGVLAARLNLKRFYRLINDSTGLGETGETVVAKKIDEALVLMAPTRHDAQSALQRKVPLGSRHAEALQDAARGQSGSGRQTDYRGVPTLAAWEYVPSLEWGLLVKIDESEAMQALNEARERTLVIVGVLIALVLASAIFAANALVRPLRELKEATDRISRGDFAVQLRIRSRDEIGELADSFERMVAAIKFFREHSRPVEDEADPDDTDDASPSSKLA